MLIHLNGQADGYPMNWNFRHLAIGETSPRMLAQIERIYVASFPPSERDPFEALVEAIRRERAALYAAIEGDTVAGFGITLALPIRSSAYLSYLAVDPAQRSGGIGGRLFRTILEEPAARGGSTALVWEVERPDAQEGSCGDAPAEDPKRRRIVFYKRNGGVLLDQVCDFQMPDLAPGPAGREPGTIPATLMWATAEARPPLTRVEVLAIVAAVYRVGYGRDLTDPLVRYVLSTVDADDSDSCEVS